MLWGPQGGLVAQDPYAFEGPELTQAAEVGGRGAGWPPGGWWEGAPQSQGGVIHNIWGEGRKKRESDKGATKGRQACTRAQESSVIWLEAGAGLPWWLSSKESTCNVGDQGLIPGAGRSTGEGNGNPLHYSCLGNPMDRGAWWATVHEVSKESDTTEQLNNRQQG